MSPTESARVAEYLRKTFGNNKIEIDIPSKKGHPVEIRIGDEFIGVIFRDEDEGEVSYAFQMAILDIDLPENI